MSFSKDPIRSILGVDVRAKHKIKEGNLDQYFLNPIIHKQIQGDEVFVPLNLNRIWSNQ
ncbi:MAG: hypothetical protein ACQEWF_23260 [Bacillota bacterium]